MTPLFKKLNLGSQRCIHVLSAPTSFDHELAALTGVSIKTTITHEPVHFAIAFAIRQVELDALCSDLVAAAEGDAILWIAYPKASAKHLKAEFNRDKGWNVFENAGYESVRIVAIDKDWSALRFRKRGYVGR